MSGNLAARNLGSFSSDSFVQPGQSCLCDNRQEARINVEIGGGPDQRKIDAFIAVKVRPDGRSKQMRTKLTDDECRNLRITVLHTRWDIWR